jgi:hypothetical protein
LISVWVPLFKIPKKEQGGIVNMRQAYQKTAWSIVAIFFVGMGIGLIGCDGGGGNAEAAPERRAETFFIQDNSFILRADSNPDITVSDGATVYRLESQGRVSFTVLGGNGRTLLLDPQDLVIERPGVQSVTVVREF